MKPRGFLFLLTCICLLAPAVGSFAQAQWLEETIYLPDEFGGLRWPNCIAFDTVRNKVYFGGGDERPGDDIDSNELEHWVVVADAATMKRVAHVQVPDRVVGLCFNPTNGKMYCSLRRADTICVIDCMTDSLVAFIAGGDAPNSMCVNPDDNKVYVANAYSDDVTVIDGNADTVLATLPMPGKPRYLCYASATNTVYCGGDRGTAVLIDGRGDSVRAVLEFGPIQSSIYGACWNPLENKYYCISGASTGPGNILYVSVFDGFGDSLLAQVPLGLGSEEAICYNPANNRVYYVSAYDSLWVIDCAADTVVNIIQLPEYLPAMIVCSPRSSRLYCLPPVREIGGLKRVMVIDCAGDSFLKFIPTGPMPIAMGHDPVQDRLYCINLESDDATVVDCGGDSVVGTVGLGFQPQYVAYASNENKVYCAGKAFQRVIAIDAETNRVVAEIPVGAKVIALCYNPALSKLYCADTATDTVTVVDCITDSVVARIGVGTDPSYLVFSPVGGSKVYCSNTHEHIVSVIDCIRDSVIARVEVAGAPLDLLVNTREDKVYCNAWGLTAAVIDCHGDTLVGRSNTGGRVLAYNPVENKAYFGYHYMFVVDGVTDSVIARLDTVYAEWWRSGCVNDRDNKVYVAATQYTRELMVVDGATDTVVAIFEGLAGGYAVSGMSYNRTNNKLYLAFSSDGFVVVLDGATDSLLGTIEVKSRPQAMVWNPIQNRTYVVCYKGSCISAIRDSVVPGVAENPARKTEPIALPSILRRGTSITSRERLVVVDCCGRRVAELRAGTRTELELPPGVYYALPHKRGPVRRLLIVD